jgi:hypothetical protein
MAPAWGDPPGYRLLVEESDLPGGDAGSRLGATCDARLQELNSEYAEKRSSGRLAPLAVVCVPEGSFQRFSRRRQMKLGGSVEQYKHPCLVPDLEFCESFVRDFSDESVASA